DLARFHRSAQPRPTSEYSVTFTVPKSLEARRKLTRRRRRLEARIAMQQWPPRSSRNAIVCTSVRRRWGRCMNRRKFFALVGVTAVAWPLEARAQQKAMPVIGYLDSGRPGPRFEAQIAAFGRGLSETDYVEGQN